MFQLYKANLIGERHETQEVDVYINKSEDIYQGDIVSIGSDGYGYKARGHATPASAAAILGVVVSIHDTNSAATLIDVFGTTGTIGTYIPALHEGKLTVISDPEATYWMSCTGALTRTNIGNGINLVQSGSQQLDHTTAAAGATRQFTILDLKTDENGYQWLQVKPQNPLQFSTAI